MKFLIYTPLLLALLTGSCTNKTETTHENGRVIHLDSFPSSLIGSRAINIWLPADYDSTKKYAVLYMHDGQMLFDSTDTWNHKEWQVDETMTRLLKDQKIRDAIVVGIENKQGRRGGDYFPEAVLETIPQDLKDSILANFLGGESSADEYLLFVIHELRPYINSNYSTHADQANTFMMGSSMGGLISLYAICEYPKVIGGVACISTHWPLADPSGDFDLAGAFRQYLESNLPPPKDHKIYFDHGTATLDSLYKPYQVMIDSIMVRHEYTAANWITKEFPGDEHSEVSWAARLKYPLEFLLGK